MTKQEIVDFPQQGILVSIIIGFLGSGKTKLLHHILKNRHLQKSKMKSILPLIFGIR
ncbi:MAG: GTP-binding protein [Okeania sp. SIO3I5]|uniref:GTP-binding protein n=1 Tax=Okeania sp. SIO3I5 TaxID=2607805 RepID=UPI0013BA9DE2|nr:GTP-binding protein [Okeania sp. SIO3I5]